MLLSRGNTAFDISWQPRINLRNFQNMCGKTSVDQPEKQNGEKNAINIRPSNLETYIPARRQYIFLTAACTTPMKQS